MKGRRSVTIIIQPEGAARARTLRVQLWAFRLLTVAAGVVLAGLLAIAALYGPLVQAALRVPGLEREIGRLRADNAKVRELSAALDSLEQRYGQVRAMIGADIVPSPVALASALPVAPTIRARTGMPLSEPVPAHTAPQRWPLDESGYITRGQIGRGDRDEAHPGLDVAVPVGSLVRAAGGGTVRQAGEDPEYGLYVLLDHADEYQTMYGHLSRILVQSDSTVAPGEVIGLSGNTGRSTAPHLHFEIRQRGLSLDPLTILKENR